MSRAITSIGVLDVLDIALVSVVAYLVIIWIRRLHLSRVLLGLGSFTVAYLLAIEFGLRVTERIFQGFFAILVIATVVILQPELRRLFERLVAWGMGKSEAPVWPGDPADLLAATVKSLAEHRFGALIVLPGRDALEHHVEGGVVLNGLISQPLLLSLFDPSTDGHDGAVVVNGGEVRLFSVHLPLSRDFKKLHARGTRHAAALGLAERTDALCIVVSEERGRVSIARDGELREVNHPGELEGELRTFLGQATPVEKRPQRWLTLSHKNLGEKALAVALAASAWLFLVSTNSLRERTFHIPILVQNLPDGYALEGFEPAGVEAVILGADTDFDLANEDNLRVRVDAYAVRTGKRLFTISERDLHLPGNLTIVEFSPRQLRVAVKEPAENMRRSPSNLDDRY